MTPWDTSARAKTVGAMCFMASAESAVHMDASHYGAHTTIMWCGNGRETTCHCGWERGRDSRTEARPPEAERHCASPSITLHLFRLTFCLFISFLRFPFLISSTPRLPSPFQMARVSPFLPLSNFSRPLGFDPPLKECHARAKAILWLFFERARSVPIANIKSRLRQWRRAGSGASAYISDFIVHQISLASVEGPLKSA